MVTIEIIASLLVPYRWERRFIVNTQVSKRIKHQKGFAAGFLAYLTSGPNI